MRPDSEPPRRAHWMRRNERCIYPQRYVCLDSEARIDQAGELQRHTFRLAAATCDLVVRDTQELRRSWAASFDDPAALWAWVTSHTRSGERVWLFAHNLGYDVRICQAFSILRAQGWELRGFSLASYRVWMRWARGPYSLVMVDTASFVPASMDAIAADLRQPRPALPDQDAPEDEWAARCHADVLLLRDVVGRVLGWLAAEQAGNLRFTGSGQALAHYRHRHLPSPRPLVHDQADVLAGEREAAWTGRCEVWRWGRVAGPVAEWDCALAYARVCRSTLLPRALVGLMRRPSLKAAQALGKRYRWLAQATITIDQPALPARGESGILWPTGTFSGWYWDCEVDLAAQLGAQIQVHQVAYYHAAAILAEWAEWAIRLVESPADQVDPVVRRMVKQWTRSLVGRFGLRVPVWQDFARAGRDDLAWIPVQAGEAQDARQLVQVGRDVWEQTGSVESESSMPQVTSAVMADLRVRLWHMLEAAGWSNVLYCDTDSVLVNAAGSLQLRRYARRHPELGLRVKGKFARAELRAPRQVELAGETRVSGLPRSAVKVGRWRFMADTWQGVTSSLQAGTPDEVTVWTRAYRINGVDKRRRHLRHGATAAFRVESPSGV